MALEYIRRGIKKQQDQEECGLQVEAGERKEEEGKRTIWFETVRARDIVGGQEVSLLNLKGGRQNTGSLSFRSRIWLQRGVQIKRVQEALSPKPSGAGSSPPPAPPWLPPAWGLAPCTCFCLLARMKRSHSGEHQSWHWAGDREMGRQIASKPQSKLILNDLSPGLP